MNVLFIRVAKSTERQEGEALLQRTLTAYRREMSEQYTSNDWARLIEALLVSVELERAALIAKTRTAAGQARLETRLSRLARDLCSVLDIGHSQLTPRIVRAIWENALGVLPLREDELCKPLLLDYARILKCLLCQPVYRNRIVSPDWEQLVEICRCGLNHICQRVEKHQSQSPEQRAMESELAQLLCVLLSVETVSLVEHTTALLDLLLDYFKHRDTETSGRAYMLAATNHLLYEIGINKLEEVQQFTRTVFPFIAAGWDTKDLTVRRLVFQFMQCHFIDLHSFMETISCIEEEKEEDNEDTDEEERHKSPMNNSIKSVKSLLYTQQLSYYDYLVTELSSMRLFMPLRIEHIHFYSGHPYNSVFSDNNNNNNDDEKLQLFTQPMIIASSLLMEDRSMVTSWSTLVLTAHIFLSVGIQQQQQQQQQEEEEPQKEEQELEPSNSGNSSKKTKLSQRNERPVKKSRFTDFVELFLIELQRPYSFTTEIHTQSYHQLLFFILQDTQRARYYFQPKHYPILLRHYLIVLK
ncbi:hypothetical protein BDF19DRAFT_266425 [Syncephalis fuscata]|nr:hypothetical protein BDF19DRAFT_266425 [Syncephalis fuscata]